MSLHPSQSNGLLLVISGPSGVGKTSIVRRLIEACGGMFSVSATTRPKTALETDGEDYFFLDEATFQQWIKDDRFLEYAQVFGGSWYGTPRAMVEETLAAGQIVVLDVDVQGAIQVRERMPDALGIFILPPSEDELLDRLRRRGREDEAAIERRFAEARHEMEVARSCGAYDAFVVNDSLDAAASEAIAILRSTLTS